MRRLLVIFLMLLVPLQFAWVAMQAMAGHSGGSVAALGSHTHHGDHSHGHGGAHTHHGESAAIDPGNEGSDRHGDSHYHPVFVSVISNVEVRLDDSMRDAAPFPAHVSFTSHTPPLFDWPPSVRS